MFYNILQEIANILKISKLIKLLVKMKKGLFSFMEKTKQTFWATQYYFLLYRCYGLVFRQLFLISRCSYFSFPDEFLIFKIIMMPGLGQPYNLTLGMLIPIYSNITSLQPPHQILILFVLLSSLTWKL